MRLYDRNERDASCGVGHVARHSQDISQVHLAETEDVAHRKPEDVDGIFGDQRAVQSEPVAAVRAHVAVRQRDALRVARRAARVEHHAWRIDVDRVHARLEAAGVRFVPRIPEADDLREGDDLLEHVVAGSGLALRAHLVEHTRRIQGAIEQDHPLDEREQRPGFEHFGQKRRRVHEDDLRVRVREHVAELRGSARRIRGNDHAADGLDAERCRGPLHAVRSEDRSAVARHEKVREETRYGAHVRGKFAVRDLRVRVEVRACARLRDPEPYAVLALGERVEKELRGDRDIEVRRDIHRSTSCSLRGARREAAS